jgi:hypothetical protein
MNNPQRAIVTCIALGLVAVAGCERRLDASKAPRQQVATSTTVTTTPSSGNLVGTPPAPPTLPEGAPPETTPVNPQLRETPGTASSSDASKELSKTEESRQMPLPGQPNDHSNVAVDGSQRAGQVDPQQTPDRASPPSSTQRATTQQ